MNWTARTMTLAVLLSVAVCSTSWAQAEAEAEVKVKPETLPEAVKRLEQGNAKLRMELAHARASLSKANGHMTAAVTKLQATTAAHDAIAKTAGELKTRTGTLSKENARLTDLIKTLGGKEPDEKLKAALIQLADALTSNTALKTRNTKLGEELDKNRLLCEETIGVASKLRKQLAAQKAQISELRQDIAIAAGRRIAPIGSAAPPAIKPKPAKAEPTLTDVKITAVREDIASINAGAKAGIKEGMKFMILRDGGLVGTIHILQVTASEAAGVVTNGKLTVNIGDKVTTTPR